VRIFTKPTSTAKPLTIQDPGANLLSQQGISTKRIPEMRKPNRISLLFVISVFLCVLGAVGLCFASHETGRASSKASDFASSDAETASPKSMGTASRKAASSETTSPETASPNEPFPKAASSEVQSHTTVCLIEVNGVINPASSGFIVSSIENAQKKGAECIIIQLDTPGGLMESTRLIVKAILASNVPVVTYVAPSGSRAASAGVFIALASHILAMAPSTNIGAAHPVGLGGEQASKEMTEKVLNDAVASIKGLAKKHGRNEKWAEDAVRKSVSATDSEAVKLHVADFICASVPELLEKIDGMSVEVISGTKTLKTKGSEVETLRMNLRYRILNTISDPNIAYILLILGIYGIFFELSNPGAILPGVLGGIFILLSLYALQTLPVNYAGLLLIILGIILFIAEIKITSHGLLAVAGVICMTLGSLMLIESPQPFLRISWQVIAVSVASTAAFFTFAIAKALMAQRKKPTTGARGLVGESGTVVGKLDDGLKVLVHGELWNATSTEALELGDEVQVTRVDGFKLTVGRKKGSS
jgi:membrane-bound serine protease (ClpP class)